METTETRTAYQLASMAGCAGPDSANSPGAVFLDSIQDSVAEYLEYSSTQDLDSSDMAWEIADGAVPIYTYQLWKTFVDLAAWQEDVTEFGPIEDMEKAAATALYMIASRLATELIEEAREAAEEEE